MAFALSEKKIDQLVAAVRAGNEPTVPFVKELLLIKSKKYIADYIEAANEKIFSEGLLPPEPELKSVVSQIVIPPVKEDVPEPTLDDIFANAPAPDLAVVEVSMLKEDGTVEILENVRVNNERGSIVCRFFRPAERPIEDYADHEMHPTLNVKIGDLRKAGLLN